MNPEELNSVNYDESNLLIDQNSFTRYEDLGAIMKKKVPEGSIYFEGVVSDGEKNRNGYIIESNAWFKEKKYVKDFLKTGTILNNHITTQPIGRPLSFALADDGTVRVSGYVFDDVYTNGAIGRGLILGLSTGHFTHERLFMDEDTKEKITEEEFWKLSWEEMSKKNWVSVVTNAEICEFSFVTVRSNRASVLVNEIAARHNKGQTEVQRLFLNHQKMDDAKKTETNAIETPASTVIVDLSTLTAEQIAEVNKPVADENVVLKTDNEALTLKMAEMETNHAAALESQKNELEIAYNAKLVEETNTVRTTVREELAAANTNNVATTVKSPEDFRKKYGNKR